MLNIEKEIAHHEKCIKVLKLIETVNIRILGNENYFDKYFKFVFVNMPEYYAKRKKIDLAIKARLENYYLTLIKKK